MIVVDFAYGWTDEAYNGGTARMDAPVEQTRVLLDAARAKGVPIYYTTLNYRPDEGEQAGCGLRDGPRRRHRLMGWEGGYFLRSEIKKEGRELLD